MDFVTDGPGDVPGAGTPGADAADPAGQESSFCRQKVGFLTLHDCGQPVSATCTDCGCGICAKHTRVTKEAVFCMACAKKAGDRRPNDEDYSSYYYPGYRPYYWGDDYDWYDDDYYDRCSFSSDDVEVFEEHAEGRSSDTVEADFEGS